jgi:general secretion pathway protein D
MLVGALWSAAPAQELADEGATFVINLRDADIRALSEQVSEITGRSLILDPTVTGNVTVISAQPLTQAGVWDLFQSVLRVQGFAALRAGSVWRVIPQANVREAGGELADGVGTGRFDVVTRLVRLENFPAATAVAALRPLVASFGYIEALPETNSVVITDTVENADRIEAIARTLDEGDGTQLSTIPVRNGDASEIAAALTNVLGAQGGGLPLRVAIDARNNVLLVRGSPELTDRVRLLVEDLDQPGRRPPALVPVTRVYRLRFADAVRMAEVLRGVIGIAGEVTVENPVAESVFQPLPTPEAQVGDQFEIPEEADLSVGETELTFERPPVTSLADENITIQAAVELNAVVVRARAEVQDDLGRLVAELDQRRPQVLIEAAIAEISGDIAEQLGVQLGLGDAATNATFAATSFPDSGLALKNILTLLRVPVAPALTPNGLSIGLSTEDEFGILIQALAQSTKANLLSTPSITTLDNQEARILVGQNVPFRTGSFALDGDAQNPFDTIERQDIGVILRVVPQVSQGDSVQLNVSQEVSSISNQRVPDAADIITNRRLIETTVVADNAGTIVLGGLITDDRTTNKSGIPGLGDVPFVGRFFSSTGENATKRVLFVFLRPTILRTRTEISQVSNERFQRLRSIEAIPSRATDLIAEPRPIRKLPVEINGLY